jgi:hypothetical protein
LDDELVARMRSDYGYRAGWLEDLKRARRLLAAALGDVSPHLRAELEREVASLDRTLAPVREGRRRAKLTPS